MDVGCGRGEEFAAEAAPTRAGMPARATKPRACGRRWPAGSETRIMHKSRTGRFSREPTAGFFRVWASPDRGGSRSTNSQQESCNGSVSGGARRAVGRRGQGQDRRPADAGRSEEHTSELQSLMRISYAVFCLKKKKSHKNTTD